ncbi:lytic transglycosylase domain-containing protein [Paenibacillus wynnii]|uniref:lytic transglycosylase domain-containing protein n=1 Tax=Paenibacillus wynnii TaxID=268407 RepID=UPI0027D8BE6E|nr:lytic transglycosylase domain-containing protein [Paenibacillus wynnii]
MDMNSAVAGGLGQLKWTNLKGVTGKGGTVNSKESSGVNTSRFAEMLQEISEQSVEDQGPNSVGLPPGVTYKGGLLWQQLPAKGESISDNISGEISGSAEIWTESSGSGETKPTDYEDLIQAASSKYGIPVDLIKAVIDTESSFNPNVVSSAGAKGLMQLMDGTANGLGVSDPFDPAQSIDGGVRYLSYQLKRFDGQEKMALAAYNAGPGRVSRLGVSNDEELMAQLSRLPKETQSYISKIERARDKYAV